eukprot:7211933-Lingulodinium_polyedra.AAC.1
MGRGLELGAFVQGHDCLPSDSIPLVEQGDTAVPDIASFPVADALECVLDDLGLPPPLEQSQAEVVEDRQHPGRLEGLADTSLGHFSHEGCGESALGPQLAQKQVCLGVACFPPCLPIRGQILQSLQLHLGILAREQR